MNLVMKKIFLLTFVFLAAAYTAVFAQMEGKRFISGSLSVGFGNNNPSGTTSTNSYGYNFDIGLGKFKTNTRASGWNLNTSLTGGKQYLGATLNPRITTGINGFGVGVGRFWQYYKHFSEKFGVYGGPNVNLGYEYGKNTSSQDESTFETKQNTLSLSLGLEAGAYYKLNERWWLLASIGFSEPFSAKYSNENTLQVGNSQETTTKHFIYAFSPVINFPSVGLGLRYFFKD
jgi:hypothetical protein